MGIFSFGKKKTTRESTIQKAAKLRDSFNNELNTLEQRKAILRDAIQRLDLVIRDINSKHIVEAIQQIAIERQDLTNIEKMHSSVDAAEVATISATLEEDLKLINNEEKMISFPNDKQKEQVKKAA